MDKQVGAASSHILTQGRVSWRDCELLRPRAHPATAAHKFLQLPRAGSSGRRIARAPPAACSGLLRLPCRASASCRRPSRPPAAAYASSTTAVLAILGSEIVIWAGVFGFVIFGQGNLVSFFFAPFYVPMEVQMYLREYRAVYMDWY
jgi:hypothetical protein